ncbi:hypothetical protein [Thermoflexus sp.]|uniref:hypothetical protein n=1 Tax=Thermoflexus sp. TaxID=1969742 RepID=UPI0025D5A60E|nr:hypothetical protein [Thermoflexus sp.]MCS6963755.1 hypothetical protein [Thermoflexus sp.]MCX7689513.1 hypothetical protein [Thermoflexus sp.]MDW8184567.1 hypothetical protein [Anaerolineae bacterium]
MITVVPPEVHWFYAEKRPSAGAVAEQLRQSLWFVRLQEAWVSPEDPTRKEPPFRYRGYWRERAFEIEFEPRRYVILRAAEDLPKVVEALQRSLGVGPAFSYIDEENGVVYEWRWGDREARWQELQGIPRYQRLRRLDRRGS